MGKSYVRKDSAALAPDQVGQRVAKSFGGAGSAMHSRRHCCTFLPRSRDGARGNCVVLLVIVDVTAHRSRGSNDRGEMAARPLLNVSFEPVTVAIIIVVDGFAADGARRPLHLVEDK